jgi:NADP-dependent 3-hydroxy acid dehydrogenase YdfG
LNFSDLRVVVTGASSGIGLATAIELTRHGARVGFVARRADLLQKLVAECGPLAAAYPADLAREDDIKALAGKIEKNFERLDVLVHSAGMIQTGTLENSSVDILDVQYTANVRAPYVLTKLMLPMLRQAQGQVVFVNSSIVRAFNTASRGQFAATQHALRAIADSLRDEVNGDGIRVTSIFPGTTASPRQERLHIEAGRSYTPDRLLQPEDVAKSILFAISMGRSGEVTDLFLRPMKSPTR